MKTKFLSPESVSRKWHLVDATDMVLGRMASRVASILRGKHNTAYSPHVDAGDFVVVINAEKIQVSGGKEEKKVYWRHSGYIGGTTAMSFKEQMDAHPTRAIEAAIRGMLPKTRLGRRMFKKLKVYAGESHPHIAQNPASLSI